MKEPEVSSTTEEKSSFSRRDFLGLTRNVLIGTGIAGLTPGLLWLDNAVAAIPASKGYLLVDTKKCQGCASCMLACSLVHEGGTNPSLSRIQIVQNPFDKWPDDVTIEQCRQCVEPACVEACPADALKADPEHGNIRTIDEEKCIGCLSCVQACPFTPGRAIWNFQEDHAQNPGL